jgi:hypothetical protein
MIPHLRVLVGSVAENPEKWACFDAKNVNTIMVRRSRSGAVRWETPTVNHLATVANAKKAQTAKAWANPAGFGCTPWRRLDTELARYRALPR